MATGKKKTTKKTGTTKQGLLQLIPQVDEVLGWLSKEPEAPPVLVKQSVREVLEELRQRILAGKKITKAEFSKKKLVPAILNQLDQKLDPNFKRVINATGVVIHTNLGRSVLPPSVADKLAQAAIRYSNLEFDLTTGKRGSRYSLVEQLLCDLTGAEAALVVNNNAAAVLLVLETLAKGHEVIVSRGQLVEIGGSFRVPEVMAKSGAKLVEVGATNRTHLEDYESAVTEETAMLLKVHASNFEIVGFTKEVTLEELVQLAGQRGLLVMEDLGSGCFMDMSRFGLRKEPTVQEVVEAGADVVTFSGDKLLGGPQAGLIVGKRQVVDRIKKNQLTRALRIDKFTLAALESILRLYFDHETVFQNIPTLSMLTSPLETIGRRAQRLNRRIKKTLASKCHVHVMTTGSMVGGGALPAQSLESRAVVLEPQDRSVNDLEEQLRGCSIPVIGRIEEDRYLLDMRTIADDEIPILANTLLKTFGVQAS
jgi:L-seryl-tRNA(Ser) seleniumtransferase